MSISPQVLKASIVVVNRNSGAAERVIAFQYNPDSLNRSLQIQGASEGGDRLEALRLTGPPVETYSLEAEFDAAEQLEFPDRTSNQLVVEVGLSAQLAALESLLYPHSDSLRAAHDLARRGAIEILPAMASLPLLVLGPDRVLPVRITELNVVEEAFDTTLRPIRAKVSLGFRVLNTNDLPFESTGGSLYLVYQQAKERLAERYGGGSLPERF